MLKIHIIAVGKVKEPYLKEGIAQYQRRIGAFARLEMLELKHKSGIEKYADKNAYLLDAAGQEYSSEDLAALLKRQDADVYFIIGDAEGVSAVIKRKFKLLSLSRMTFAHEMCQLFLVEQIYRACMINDGREYHK